MTPGPGATIHATAVLVGRDGVLIRGAAGSGKSALAAALIAGADTRIAVRLIADDAVVLRAVNGRLVATAPAPTAGLIEARGVGLVGTAWEARGVVRLVVDLVDGQSDRLPETPDATAALLGLALPRIALPARQGDTASKVVLALDVLRRREPLPALPVDGDARAPIRA